MSPSETLPEPMPEADRGVRNELNDPRWVPFGGIMASMACEATVLASQFGGGNKIGTAFERGVAAAVFAGVFVKAAVSYIRETRKIIKNSNEH